MDETDEPVEGVRLLSIAGFLYRLAAGYLFYVLSFPVASVFFGDKSVTVHVTLPYIFSLVAPSFSTRLVLLKPPFLFFLFL